MTSSEYYTRGLEFMTNNNYDRAIEDFKSAIKIEPNYPIAKNKLYWAYWDRAHVFLEKKEFDRAIADYTEAINIDPNKVSAYSSRGIAYDIKGDSTKAIADWETVLKIQPDDDTAKELIEMVRKRH